MGRLAPLDAPDSLVLWKQAQEGVNVEASGIDSRAGRILMGLSTPDRRRRRKATTKISFIIIVLPYLYFPSYVVLHQTVSPLLTEKPPTVAFSINEGNVFVWCFSPITAPALSFLSTMFGILHYIEPKTSSYTPIPDLVVIWSAWLLSLVLSLVLIEGIDRFVGMSLWVFRSAFRRPGR